MTLAALINRNRKREYAKIGSGSRRSLAKIGFAQSLAEQIAQSYGAGPPKTTKKLIDAVIAACNTCYEVWGETPGEADMARVDENMKAVEVVTRETRGSASAYGSLALALLSDAYDDTGGKYSFRKREVLRSLLTAMARLHRNYDRKLDRWHEYDVVNRVVKKLYLTEV